VLRTGRIKAIGKLFNEDIVDPGVSGTGSRVVQRLPKNGAVFSVAIFKLLPPVFFAWYMATSATLKYAQHLIISNPVDIVATEVAPAERQTDKSASVHRGEDNNPHSHAIAVRKGRERQIDQKSHALDRDQCGIAVAYQLVKQPLPYQGAVDQRGFRGIRGQEFLTPRKVVESNPLSHRNQCASVRINEPLFTIKSDSILGRQELLISDGIGATPAGNTANRQIRRLRRGSDRLVSASDI